MVQWPAVLADHAMMLVDRPTVVLTERWQMLACRHRHRVADSPTLSFSRDDDVGAMS